MKKLKLFFVLFLIFAGFLFFFSKSCDQIYLSFIKEASEGSKINVGDNYIIASDGNSKLTIMDTNRTTIISGQVFAWNFDSIFVIAKQKPYYSISDSIHNKYPNITYDKLLKLYNESKVYNYWIIDKRESLKWDTINRRHTGSIKGPFTYEEYLEKRKELDVPASLELKEANYYIKHYKAP